GGGGGGWRTAAVTSSSRFVAIRCSIILHGVGKYVRSLDRFFLLLWENILAGHCHERQPIDSYGKEAIFSFLSWLLAVRPASTKGYIMRSEKDSGAFGACSDGAKRHLCVRTTDVRTTDECVCVA
ncbi:unnamed protein product, partial [Hapterophycus canaliculatus]